MATVTTGVADDLEEPTNNEPVREWDPPYFDLGEAAAAYGMNGRESAFYLLGRRTQWIERMGISPSEGEQIDQWVAAGGSCTRIRVRVSREHLAAVTAVLVVHGCRVECFSTAADAITLNID